MEQEINPYQPGEAPQQGYNDPTESMPVTAVALSSLIATKFWVLLVGVTMLLTVLINVLQMFYGDENALSGASGAELFMWLIPIAMVVLQIILAVRLIQYGQAIGRLRGSSDDQDFERAMDVHTKFWKLAGIMIIVGVVLLLVSLGVVMTSFAIM